MKKFLLTYFLLIFTQIVYGQDNNSLNFDGSSDRVEIPYGALNGLENVTFSCWFYNRDTDSHYQTIIHQAGGMYIRYEHNDSNFHFVLFAGGNGSNQIVIDAPSQNEWHHIAVTYNGSNVTAYLDGEIVGNIEASGSIFNANPIFIGNYLTYYIDYNPDTGEDELYTTTEGFSGNLDEIKIWSTALNQEQINANINFELSGNESNLVGYWNFNEGQGDILYDLTGNGYNGTIFGALWDENGAPVDAYSPTYGCNDPYAENYNPEADVNDGSCFGYPDNGDYSLSFDGNSVNVGEIGDYSSQVTLMGWVKTTDDQSYHAIVSGNCGNIMLTMHGGKILFGSQCSSPISHDTYGTTELNNGDWYHVAATYDEYGDENNLKVYVNGNLEGESTKSGQFSGATGNFTIGSAPSGGESIDGNLDMVRIWSTALTQNQIQDNMLSNFALVDDGLLADWKVSAGEGNILYDYSGNGNHATINGPSWSEDVYVLPIPPVIGGNNSLIFDGVDDLVQLSQDAFSGETGTLMAWFNPKLNLDNAFDSGKSIYCQGASTTTYATFGVGLRPHSIWLEMGAPGNQIELTNNSFNYDSWNHIAVSFEYGLVNTYMNGSLVSTLQAPDSTISNNGHGAFIGRRGNTSNVDESYSFQGMISHFSSTPYALNQYDILQSMVSDTSFFDGSIWNFNEGEGITLTDLGSNGNDGTIIGATWTGDAPEPLVSGCMDNYAENYDPYANSNDGSCIYSNEAVTFIKEDYADPFMEGNQDRITANVWITRGDNNSLYNAAFESYSDHDISPVGTIWSSGQTALQTNLNGYKSFREATGGNHRDLPGRIMSMYLVEENIFYDVEFHSWTSNNNGGGFSYTRTLAEINSFDYGADAVYFEKEDYADWSDSYNQDRITDRTWITRDNQQGILNAFSEESYHFNSGDSVHSAPSNTLWAFGRTNEVSPSDYKPFKLAVQDTISMIDLPGHIFSLFLITEDLYYDVEFHSWTSNGNGGGFSYTRTDQYGNSVTFIKQDYADHSLEQNQDRISDGVWITRSEQHPLINYAQEQNYYDAPILYMNANGSPENTEWAFGRTVDLSIVDYQPWQAAIGGQNPRGALGQFMSLHLIEEDIYFDVVFHSWTCCGDGGGFSYTRIPVENDVELLNGSLSGRIYLSSDSSFVVGAHIVAVTEDNSYSADTFSDSLGYYSLHLIGSANYYVSVSFEGFSTYSEYMFIAPFEETELDISLDIMQSSIVEGILTDWYSNAPLVGASVLFAFTNDNNETETIESITDENGYFMNQVPGEKDYDLFAYADGYWVEHDAFYLNSGEHQVLEISIAEMSAASRLYGTVKDFETGESIPYAEVQLNCEEASDWDRIGALGTYRVFSYYPDDCADGVLIVTADGFETSVQSVGNIEFEAGSSFDLDIALVQGNDPDPGMLSGTVYSNIDGSELGGAEIVAYNFNTTQLFTYETSDDGSFELFLPESDYLISVSVQNHSELLDSLSITSGQLLIKDFYLDQVIEYRISGVVTDQNENPLSGFETFVTNGNGYRTTYTNENGEYELYVPNGIYDVGSGSNDYFIDFMYGVEINDNDIVVDITLDRVQDFDGGFAGLVHLNNGDSASVLINVWDDNLTYNAYVSSDANGGFALPLVNGTYTIYASVPNSDYENIYIPNAFTVENNIINYDLYFIAPDGPDAPVIIYLGDVPNDQGGQLELAWTPGEPREFEIFPQYSVWRLEDEWSLISTVPYHGFDLYNVVVPTLGDSTSDGIFESTFMVTAHTLDQSVFFDSQPVSGYSIDNIYPAIPQQLMANIDGESVELSWSISADEDFSYYNVYRQDQSFTESATIFTTENNYYSDNIDIDGDYQYWVTAVDVSGNESDPSELTMVTLGVQGTLIPDEFALMQNYPNPFNPSTQIMYSLPKTSSVRIIIYNMLGSKVRTLYSGVQDAGYKNILWNAKNDQGDPVSAGMYIYTIESESFYASKKMILLK